LCGDPAAACLFVCSGLLLFVPIAGPAVSVKASAVVRDGIAIDVFPSVGYDLVERLEAREVVGGAAEGRSVLGS
jgi:hypothetical protein